MSDLAFDWLLVQLIATCTCCVFSTANVAKGNEEPVCNEPPMSVRQLHRALSTMKADSNRTDNMLDKVSCNHFIHCVNTRFIEFSSSSVL